MRHHVQPDLKDAAKLTFRSGCPFLEDERHSLLDSRRKGKAAPDGRPHTWRLPTPLIYSDATGLITIKDLGRLQHEWQGNLQSTLRFHLKQRFLFWHTVGVSVSTTDRDAVDHALREKIRSQTGELKPILNES
jgi:hypothetical protein